VRKYVRGLSGVMRSWRFQPAWRSAAIRAPRAEHGVHRAERGEADHQVERRRDPASAQVVLVAVRAGDGQV
jgi:hypothetical protein